MESEISSNLWQTVAADFSLQGYEISSCISATANSLILKGKQSILGRDVVIKILPLDAGDNLNHKRLEREAKLLASFDHPNIVKLYGVGQLPDGRSYFVMELIEGKSFVNLIESQEKLEEKRIRRLAVQVCSALAYAHERKVIHRDIKPGNLIISDFDGQEIVKLIDFGIHKSTDETNQKLTQTGSVPGTPNYMSPEQCKGLPLDERSDIYALGAVLYELCTGKPPMDAETDWMILSNHQNKEILRLPEPCCYSRELEKLVVRCLQKDPAQRYASASELATLLEQPFKQGRAEKIKSKLFALGALIIVTLFWGLQCSGILPQLPFSKTDLSKTNEKSVLDDKEAKMRWIDFKEHVLKDIGPINGVLAIEKFRSWFKLNTAEYSRASLSELADCFNACFPDDWKNDKQLKRILSKRLKAMENSYSAHNPEEQILFFRMRMHACLNDWSSADSDLALIIKSKADNTYKKLAVHTLSWAYILDGRIQDAIRLENQYEYLSKDNPESHADFYHRKATLYQTVNRSSDELNCLLQSAKEYGKAKTITDYQSFYTLAARLNEYLENLAVRSMFSVHPYNGGGFNSDKEALAYLEQLRALILLGVDKEMRSKLFKALENQKTLQGPYDRLRLDELRLQELLLGGEKAKVLRLAKDQMRQFYASYPQFAVAGLSMAWSKYPDMIEPCLKELDGHELTKKLTVAGALANAGHLLRSKQNTQDSIIAYKLAEKYFVGDETNLTGQLNLFMGEAMSYAAEKQLEKSNQALDRALQCIDRLGKNCSLESRCSVLQFQGSLLCMQGKVDAGIAVHKALISELEKSGIADNPDHMRSFAYAVHLLADEYVRKPDKKAGLDCIAKYLPLIDPVKEQTIYNLITSTKETLLKMP